MWLYFYRIFITDQQVGLLDGVAFAIGLIAEVPSGALADRFGRDNILRIGQALVGFGILFQGVGSSFTAFLIGQSIMMIGISFVSGADEALFFENLKFDRASSAWKKLLIRGSQAALTATLFATVVGGALHTVNPRIPWFLTGVSFLIATIIVFPISDTRERVSRKTFFKEIREYITDIKDGFAEFRLPKLSIYLPLIITVQGLFYATGYGLLKIILLGRFGFSPFLGAVAVAVCGLITILLLSMMHKYADEFSEKKVLSLIALSAAAGLILSLADIGLWGFVVILVLYVGEYLLQPFMSEIINYHAPERHRATVLSVSTFARSLPYVLLAPLIGYLSTNGKLNYFLIVWPTLIVASLLFYLKRKQTDSKIEVPVDDIHEKPAAS